MAKQTKQETALVSVEKIKKDALALIPPVSKLPVKIASREEAAAVTAQRHRDNKAVALLEEMRKRIVEPFNAAVKNANSTFKEVRVPLELRVEAADRLLIAFSDEEEAKATKNAEKVAAKLEKKGQYDQADAVRDQAELAGAPVGEGMAYVEKWVAVVEEKDKALVPAYFNGVELREIKQSALSELARLTEGQAKIPGVTMKKIKEVRGSRK